MNPSCLQWAPAGHPPEMDGCFALGSGNLLQLFEAADLEPRTPRFRLAGLFGELPVDNGDSEQQQQLQQQGWGLKYTLDSISFGQLAVQVSVSNWAWVVRACV